MDPTKVRTFDPEKLPALLNKCITVDPASSTDTAKGDPTLIGAFAMDHKSNVYILDVSRKWLPVDEIVDEIIYMHKLHGIRDIGVERVALSKWLIQLLDKRIKDETLNINLIEITRDPSIRKKGEGGRQERVAGFLNQGQILIRNEEPEKEIIMRELGEWPSGRFDDFMDTLTDAIEILKPPHILKNTANQYRMPPRTLAGRSNIQTGYSYRSDGYSE
jgi:phage terminase large subunit-like protein